VTLLLTIRIERIHDNPKEVDSFRILVDTLWQHGLSKDKIKVDLWQKDIAPSNSSRKWFRMMRRNKTNLNLDTSRNWIKKEMQLTQSSKKLKNNIQLPYYMLQKKRKLNNAVALKEFLEGKIQK
jgi:uncharacterized protein YeaO (DUF488 family)